MYYHQMIMYSCHQTDKTPDRHHQPIEVAIRKEILDFPGGPVVKTVFPMQGAWVQSLEGERSHMPLGVEKKNFFKLKKNKNKKTIDQ